MADVPLTDAAICCACGNTERASEGYPCVETGRFICLLCTFRGIVRWSEGPRPVPPPPGSAGPRPDQPRDPQAPPG